MRKLTEHTEDGPPGRRLPGFVGVVDDALDVAAAAQRRPSNSNSDAKVEQAEDAHGHDEEDEGGHFEQVGRVLVLQDAKRRLGDGLAGQIDSCRAESGLGRIRHVRDAGVDGEGQGRNEGHQPNESHDAGGPSQPGHRVSVKRMADGQIALQRESHDCQHRGVIGPWVVHPPAANIYT